MSTYLTIDTANPNLDTILMWVRNAYAEQGGEFVPEFNEDRTKVLIQLKSKFAVNPIVENAALERGDISWIQDKAEHQAEWTERTPIPFATIVDYFTGASPLIDFLAQIKDTAVFGLAVLDFGSGNTEASVTIEGQDGIKVLSSVQAWLRLGTTQDHSPDEHKLETISVAAGDIVPGVGFTIYGTNNSQLNEPTTPPRMSRISGTTADQGPGRMDAQGRDDGGKSTLIYGRWIVAWRWQ